ncbi:MAG: LysR family transcriptional regulator [Geminicoccaceae bacterium]
MVPFRQLTYLVAVADSGSISAAAERLGISQPALSAAIQKIESDFNLDLFIRERPHRLMLSPVGRRFVAQTRRLLESAEEFNIEARNLGQTLDGTIEVGCFIPTAPFIIPIILEGLRARGLNISLQVHEADLDELNNLLGNGSIEVALTYDMYPSPSIDFEPLIEAPPYALLPKDDPLAERASVSLVELATRDMVVLNLPITQQFFLSLFSQANLRPRIKHQAKTYEMVRSLVGAGEGYAILIMRPVNERAYDGRELAYLPLRDPIPPSHYGLAFKARSMPTKLVEAFASTCRDLLKVEKQAEKYYVRPPTTWSSAMKA